MTKLSCESHLNIFECDYDELSKKPFRWGEDIIKEKKFFTKDNRANIHFVENKLLSEKRSLEYPFLLITGRTRDQWHSGTKTNLLSKLKKYKPNSYIEINELDAQKLEIKNDDKVKVSTKRGVLVLTALVTKNINKGVVFVPISERKINYLTNDLVDSLSEQPDYNHNATKLEKHTEG